MNFSEIWLQHLDDLLVYGDPVAPRGKNTLELLQKTIAVPMRYPVLNVPQRRLSYQFMAAEAYWILMGDNRVATIAPYNKNIANFSDDGKIFFGAYGPKIAKQLPYVIETLRKDPQSRQAGLTIWRENPPETLDVPCTVSIFASIRRGELNLHVFMRSSDAWLGVPYDVFNFSMLGHLLCAELNVAKSEYDVDIVPGTLYLTAASSHLYEENITAAAECLATKPVATLATPELLYRDARYLMGTLRALRDSKPGDAARWWEVR